MRASLESCRLLGLDIPEGVSDEPYAETTTPTGLRVAWGRVTFLTFETASRRAS